MALRYQLEIVTPLGETSFHDLDGDQGITNIGRDAANDIVIDSPGVGSFHAVLDTRQRPYHVTILSPDCETLLEGAPLPVNAAHELRSWDTLTVAGYSLILLETDGAGGQVVPSSVLSSGLSPADAPAAATGSVASSAAPVLRAIPADQVDDVVMAQLAEREREVAVEQTASFDLTVVNGGDIVATLVIAVEGMDPDWVTISPPQVNLYEGARATVNVAITPPRQPTSLAGAHPFAIVVGSPNHPGHATRLGASLTISPYYEFAIGDLSPKQQTVSFRKRTGGVTLPLVNKGNSETSFRLSVEDDERACLFEFLAPQDGASLVRQAEFRLPPAGAFDVPIRITPLHRRFMGLRKRDYAFTVSTTMAEGDQMPRSVMGQLKSAPLVGPWQVALFLLCLALLVGFLFRPAPLPVLETSVVTTNRPDEPVGIAYNASRFPTLGTAHILNRLNGLFLKLSLEYGTGDGKWQVVKGPAELAGISGTVSHVPPSNGRYRLRADNLISQLVPMLQGNSREAEVYVTPVEPKILKFVADHDAILLGQQVTLYWQVQDADTLTLAHDGIEETLSDKDLERGQRSFSPDKETTYTLVAAHRSWNKEVKLPRAIKVLLPTPTPVPLPVIVRFDVAPLTITAGEAVKIGWEVSGADTVTIEHLGNGLPLKGDVSDQPAKSTFYQLTAIKQAVDGSQVKTTSLLKEVTVNPQPTGTPVPMAPEIQLFEATPKEVILGSGPGVKLAWAVNGTTSNVEIVAPDFKLTGLSAQDYVSVTVKSTTLFVLTAYNGDLKTSKAVEVKGLEPTPTPTGTPPPTPPPPTATPYPPPIISYFKAEPANPPGDIVTFKNRDTTGGDPVFAYDVEAGSGIKLSWTVANADKVSLIGFEDQPATNGSKTVVPGESRVYQLRAENNKGQNIASAFVRVDLRAPKPPPPPVALTGIETAGGTQLTWSYDKAYIDKITGYRIYRADLAKNGDFAMVLALPNPQLNPWLDNTLPTCGKAYYVVATYIDILDNKEKETAASVTSWYSKPCQ